MKWHDSLAVGLLMAGCLVIGSAFPLSTMFGDRLEAQGRGAVNPPPPAPTPSEIAAETVGTAGSAPVVYAQEGGQSAAGNGFLAVTGSYGVGTSVLYLIDTENRQLAVYEARGGSTEQRRIVMVGARKLDLDLQLEGYNDRSEYPYRKLKTLFEKRDRADPDVSTGLGSGR